VVEDSGLKFFLHEVNRLHSMYGCLNHKHELFLQIIKENKFLSLFPYPLLNHAFAGDCQTIKHEREHLA